MAEVETVSSHFLARFSSLPVVHTALGYATNTYGRVKEANPVIAFTFTTAEKSVLFANEKAKPYVKRFERQISMADVIACKGLEKLEEKVPLITKPTDLIVQDTKALYNNTIKTGVDSYNNVKTFGTNKVNAVKNYGFQTAAGLMQSPYGKIVTDSVDGALSITENCLEHILPPLDESDIDDVKKTEVLERVTRLTSRIQHRIYRHAIHKAQNLKQVTTDSIRQYSSSEMVTNAYSNATWVWEELNKEPVATENMSLNHQILNTARFSTRQLVSAFATAKTTIHIIPSRINNGILTVYNFSTTVLPSHLNSSLTTIYGHSTNAVAYIHNVNPQEVATAIVSMKDRFQIVERFNFIVQIASQNPAIQWLVQQVSKETHEQSPSELHE